MKKAYRIKKNKEFQYIFKHGKSFANRQLVIFYEEKPGQEHIRIGLSVGTKIGNAVMRNKIKRYLRESFRVMEKDIKPNLNIIIIARQPTKNMGLQEFKKSLSHLLYKQGLFKSSKKRS